MKCLSEFNKAYPCDTDIRTDFSPENSVCADDLYISQLINWHMIPGNSWDKSEASTERDRKLITAQYPQLFDDIMLLHMADRMGH